MWLNYPYCKKTFTHINTAVARQEFVCIDMQDSKYCCVFVAICTYVMAICTYVKVM